MAVSATLQARLLIHTNLRCDDRGRVVECIDCSPLATGQTDEPFTRSLCSFSLVGLSTGSAGYPLWGSSYPSEITEASAGGLADGLPTPQVIPLSAFLRPAMLE